MLECQLCCDRFDTEKPGHLPKLLPCGHTFCAGCIDKSIEMSHHRNDAATLQCPVCKESVLIPLNATQLRNNYTIMSLLASFASSENKSKVPVS